MSDIKNLRFGVCDVCLKPICQCPKPQAPHALTREQCSLCTANRPRLCDQHYKQGADELLKHVTAAIQDQQTPGGVKATYEQLLELCNQQRQALAQQAQELEGQAARIDALRKYLSATITERDVMHNSREALVDTVKELRQQLAALQARCREMERDRDSWKIAMEGLERQHKALTDQIPSDVIQADPILLERVTTAQAIEVIGREQIAQLQATLAEREAELEQAERALRAKGYRKECDIPACNCGPRWFHGGHAEARLKEIDEALPWVNGKTILTRVIETVAERDAAVQDAARMRALIKQVVNDLPAKRDWLDPDLEKALKGA